MSSCDINIIFQVLSYNPVLGAFLIGSCIVFMTFVVLNLFISVILVAFSQEQIHHKVTNTYRKLKAQCVTIPRDLGLTSMCAFRFTCWYFLTSYPLSLQPSDEEEIVELMLMKLCSLFGIKCKKQDGNQPNERAPAPKNAPSTISSGKIEWRLVCSLKRFLFFFCCLL